MKGTHALRRCSDTGCRIEYESVIEFFSEPVLIIQNLEIVCTNKAAKSFFGSTFDANLEIYLKDQLDTATSRLKHVLETHKSSKPFDYEIYRSDGSCVRVEMISHYIHYNCYPAVMVICKDVTFQKFDLMNASWLQLTNMMKKRPPFEHGILRTVYVPSRTLSGDFFFFEKLESENKLIGVLGDVRGKGVNAALKISAFEVLFREILTTHTDIVSITDLLNIKVMRYMEDCYIAAIVFNIDYEKRTLELIGAGMNEFFIVNHYEELIKEVIRGPFLGMFENIGFEYAKYRLEQVKRLILFSDGIDALMQLGTIEPEQFLDSNFLSIHNIIAAKIEDQSTHIEGIPDDCTLLIFEFEGNKRLKEYFVLGLNHYMNLIDQLIHEMAWEDREFDLRMILSELIVNAYHYGNLRDPELPIIITAIETKTHRIIEVLDMGFQAKPEKIIDTILEEELLSEGGRGLFIVNQLADSVEIGIKSIVVKLKKEEW